MFEIWTSMDYGHSISVLFLNSLVRMCPKFRQLFGFQTLCVRYKSLTFYFRLSTLVCLKSKQVQISDAFMSDLYMLPNYLDNIHKWCHATRVMGSRFCDNVRRYSGTLKAGLFWILDSVWNLDDELSEIQNLENSLSYMYSKKNYSI